MTDLTRTMTTKRELCFFFLRKWWCFGRFFPKTAFLRKSSKWITDESRGKRYTETFLLKTSFWGKRILHVILLKFVENPLFKTFLHDWPMTPRTEWQKHQKRPKSENNKKNRRVIQTDNSPQTMGFDKKLQNGFTKSDHRITFPLNIKGKRQKEAFSALTVNPG